jgi:thiamine monophosphate synthase
MFIIKNNYYLYIKNSKDIDIDQIKKNRKITIIYRCQNIVENKESLVRFRKQCALKGFKFYIANNIELVKICKADGLYLSSYNKKIYLNKNIKLIGSAHSFREIDNKIKQGCETIFFSRLFKTSYADGRGYLGVVKYNLITKNFNVSIVPLGGINQSNLNRLNLVNTKGLALLSEVKKKPVIANRLF